MGLRRGLMAISAGGGGSDPYFANVVSLFNGAGQPNGTTFNDVTSKVWTPAGDAQVLDEQVECDGSGDRISTPNATDWDFVDGDFCVEMFVTADTATGNHVLIGKRNGAGYTPFGIGIFGSKLQMLVSQSGANWASTAADPGDFPTATQQHIALERVGDTLYLLRQGDVVATHLLAGGALMTSGDVVIIGMWGTTLFPFDGRFKSWRVTKGLYRYGGAYTVPPSLFPTS